MIKDAVKKSARPRVSKAITQFHCLRNDNGLRRLYEEHFIGCHPENASIDRICIRDCSIRVKRRVDFSVDLFFSIYYAVKEESSEINRLLVVGGR